MRLFEIEDADKSRQAEHFFNVLVDIAQHDLLAVCLCLFEDTEQDAEPTGSDVLQLGAVDNYIAVLILEEGLQAAFHLNGRRRVEFANKRGYDLIV